MTDTNAATLATFKDHWHHLILNACPELLDVSVEVGCYDRCAFKGTPVQWAQVKAALVAYRSSAVGSDKASATAAISRIW